MRTSRKITYSAVSVAIASVSILIGRFTSVRFVPLMVASLCFFIALSCGIPYGLMTMAASMLLTFFWGSVDITMFLLAVLFAPYSIMAYFMRPFRYTLPVMMSGSRPFNPQNNNPNNNSEGSTQTRGDNSSNKGGNPCDNAQNNYNQGNNQKSKPAHQNAGWKLRLLPRQAGIRVAAVVILFNAALALIYFVLLPFAGEILLGFNPLVLIEKLGKVTGYILLAVSGSIYMVGFDFMLVKATDIFSSRLKLIPPAARHSGKTPINNTENDKNNDVFGN